MTILLTVLGAIVPYLPILLNLAGFAIKYFGASDANLKQYQDMIEKNKDAGNISVENYQKLSDWHQQMIDAANAKADQMKKLADIHQTALDKVPQPNAPPKT